MFADEPVRYDGRAVVRITPESVRELRTVLALSEDVWSHGVQVGRASDFMVSAEAQRALAEAGVKAEVLIPDVQALVDAERARLQAAAQPPDGAGLRGGAWFTEFRDDAAIEAFMNSLTASRPDLAATVSVGSTVQGRAIRGVRITGGGDAAAKPAVVITAGQHAREWISPMSAAYLADRLVRTHDTDPRVRALLESVVVYVVPVVNRDGYVHSWTTARLWRKNRRPNADGSIGVDLNRNWDFQWGGPGASANGADLTYRGPSAASEPEVAGLAAFMLARPETALHVDLHSYGQLVLLPWGHTPETGATAATLDGVAAEMVDAIDEVTGAPYRAGSVRRVLYPASGSATDWATGAAGVHSMTMELRDTGETGFILPPAQIIPTSRETFEALMVAMESLAASRLAVTFPDGVPAVAPARGKAHVLVRVQRGGLRTPTSPPLLLYRDSPIGEWRAAAATVVDASTGLWEVEIPGGEPGKTTRWYLECDTLDASGGSGKATYPAGGRRAALEVRAGNVVGAFADEFETDRGWTFGAPGDNAAAGAWVRGDPEGTVAQAEDDASPRPGAALCAYTGFNFRDSESVGDVDGGGTTLVSPVIDISGLTDPVVSYNRWFCNRTGSAVPDDALVVEVSGNGGGTWHEVERVGPVSPEALGGWRRASWRMRDFVPTGNALRVRFVASDTGTPGLVEAAVDDFRIESFVAPPDPCPGDVSGDGRATTQDIFDFIEAFLDGRGDFNGVDGVTAQDFYDFLAAWLPGC